MSKDDKAKLDAITASADAVSFSRSLTSGTKVGTITINGTATDLYAPTNTDTHWTTGLKVGASATATANAAATNGNVYLNALDNTTVRDSHKIVGSGATSVTSDANGVITISSTDNNTWRGIQNNLTSDSTTDSLSAAQGKVLKALIDGKATSSHTHNYLPLSGGTLTGNLTTPSLNTAFLFNNSDIPEGAANLADTASAHKMSFYHNGIIIPYQMDNTNDGGIIRCRGTSESNTIFELGT